MDPRVSPSAAGAPVDIEEMAAFIAAVQKENGEIPWSPGGKTDPWDHVESAMGLSVAGRIGDAERAYAWMAATQLDDGSWWSSMRDGVPEDRTRETNFSSYVAVGVFHHYLVTGDRAFLRRLWPTVKAGVDFAVRLQARAGEIYWAKNPDGAVDPMALLTGSSSVFMSLRCALAAAAVLGKRKPAWGEALRRLGEAIRMKPSLFNMIKSRFSMDWYYPILCGAVTGAEARRRIDRSWEKFVIPDWGVRCVSDQPWVTLAETSELVMALAACGRFEQARILFNWILNKKDDQGRYWMGMTVPDGVIWPEERTSWTAAAVLLAYDTLYDVTPAGRLFRHESWGR
ncbi:MAG: hypothetical protein A4E73_00046 [Syntrophaceae bacterium PtaU1.Bin231]|nr:MAG: hypothetical protein A4E73_00046 [Syntrophaceae bacterium PtaU1.Bin231]